MVRPSDLPLGWTSFRFPLDCCVLIFLRAPLCCFRLHSASQLLFNPPSTVSCVRLSRRHREQRHAPGAFRCENEHLKGISCYVHTLRCQIMFFHLHHHDISFDTIATRLGTVFALAPAPAIQKTSTAHRPGPNNFEVAKKNQFKDVIAPREHNIATANLPNTFGQPGVAKAGAPQKQALAHWAPINFGNRKKSINNGDDRKKLRLQR